MSTQLYDLDNNENTRGENNLKVKLFKQRKTTKRNISKLLSERNTFCGVFLPKTKEE